jgi:hypothetical protein
MFGRGGTNAEKRSAYRILVGKPEKQRQLGTLRCRSEDNIKTGLQEIV